MMKKKGFTLIELLVAISIISILSVVGVIFFGSVMKNSRDEERLRDLDSIKQALELYRHDYNSYPISSSLILSTANSFTKDSTTYLDSIPKDPLSNRFYVYQALTSSGLTCTTDADCIGFNLCAKKESSSITSFAACSSISCGSAGNCDIGVSN